MPTKKLERTSRCGTERVWLVSQEVVGFNLICLFTCLFIDSDADSSAGVEFARAEPELSPVGLSPINSHGKRRQYIPAPPLLPLAAPAVPGWVFCFVAR